MKQETGKVISIRLIYVILFFVILIVGITQGIKYFNNNEVVQIAESNQENMKQENINIASSKCSRRNSYRRKKDYFNK